MEGKIRKEIENIERRIGWKREDLEKAVKGFKESAAAYDACHIETFIPEMVKDIARYRADMAKLEEQKEMLEYMIK